jgi:hypothetical protein
MSRNPAVQVLIHQGTVMLDSYQFRLRQTDGIGRHSHMNVPSLSRGSLWAFRHVPGCVGCQAHFPHFDLPDGQQVRAVPTPATKKKSKHRHVSGLACSAGCVYVGRDSQRLTVTARSLLSIPTTQAHFCYTGNVATDEGSVLLTSPPPPPSSLQDLRKPRGLPAMEPVVLCALARPSLAPPPPYRRIPDLAPSPRRHFLPTIPHTCESTGASGPCACHGELPPMPLRVVLSPKSPAAEGVVEPERAAAVGTEYEDVFRARETQGSRAMYNTECVMEDAFQVLRLEGQGRIGLLNRSLLWVFVSTSVRVWWWQLPHAHRLRGGLLCFTMLHPHRVDRFRGLSWFVWNQADWQRIVAREGFTHGTLRQGGTAELSELRAALWTHYRPLCSLFAFYASRHDPVDAFVHCCMQASAPFPPRICLDKARLCRLCTYVAAGGVCPGCVICVVSVPAGVLARL